MESKNNLSFFELSPMSIKEIITMESKMQLLTQNSKMKKSSQNGITLVNWTLPAFQSETGFRTCPMAQSCVSGCYARSGTYRFKMSVLAHNEKLVLSQSDAFVPEMIAEIETWIKKRTVKHLKVRIHDAGDFYDLSYFEKWIKIMSHFEKDSRVSFYAYSKMIKMIKEYGPLPESFHIIFSFGGKQDSLIDREKDSHSLVFSSIENLLASGYINGTDDDMIAANPVNKKIGLVYHGVKKIENTDWEKIAA